MQILIGALMGVMLMVGGKKTVGEAQENLEISWDAFTRWDPLIQKYAILNNVDFGMIKAIGVIESDLGQAPSVARGLASPSDIDGSKSSDGKSWGLMQMILSTARDLDRFATEVKLNDPEYSIKLGAQYLRWLKSSFHADDPRFEEWVVKSYNQGIGNTRKEIDGTGGGLADEYWAKYQSKRRIIREKQGV